MTSETEILRELYGRVGFELVCLVGMPDRGLEPLVDIDRLPAAVVDAGRMAANALLIGEAILTQPAPGEDERLDMTMLGKFLERHQ